ncbi:MAG TPA: 2-oxo-4-hydroxy-4-carboxy-5-ureidoimidazoline decarboxylase [Acidisarcina sp.]
MDEVLAVWNARGAEDAVSELLPCCGSRAWAAAVVARRPLHTQDALFRAADEAWSSAGREDWIEAFACHPRIGERARAAGAEAQFARWSEQEQAGARGADGEVHRALAEGNRLYEERFGFTYIVCATGKSAEEMLGILKRRLQNDAASEIGEAAEQQRLITRLRLAKWLGAAQGSGA